MPFLPDLRAVLREPRFPRLFATRLTSQASDGIFQVALASFVFFNPNRVTSASQAATAFAVALLPYSLVGPFAGVFLDRWRRQAVLVRGNVLRALMVLPVAALVAADRTGLGFLLAALAVVSVNRFYLAALSAALPHVVTRRELVMANSVSTTAGTLLALVGGALGFGIQRALLHVGAASELANAVVLLVAAGGYLTSSALARRIPRLLLGPDLDVADSELAETREAVRHVVRGLADGARHVWHRRRAGNALAAITAHRFFYGISTIATILLYRNYFHTGEDVTAGLGGLALVFAASGLGVFVAAMITPQVTTRISKEAWIVTVFALAAVVEIVFGLPYSEPLVVVAAFALGIAAQGSKICVDTIVQESIEDAYRGRVFSFYDVLFNLAFVAAAGFGALTLPSSGKSYAVLLLVAVGYAVTALLYRAAGIPAPAVVASATEQRVDHADGAAGRA